MAQIELKSLTKSYKTGKVLQDLSLAAEEGEIVCVFGPSGVGKTVLLRLIAGVEEPDAGSIFLEGRDVTDAPPETRGVGIAFQNFALFPHMTAFDNIGSALTAHGASTATIKAKVEKVAAMLKISHVLGHLPRALSNGQKQRTALARALAADPKIVLLDDPLRNVDAKLRYEMRLELPSLLRASGATVLYVTQDYKEAMAIGDRIAVLVEGRFAQVATPPAIYRGPASVNVARLFGDPTINLISIKPKAVNGGAACEIGGAAVSLAGVPAATAGASLLLGLRPESLTVSDQQTPDSFPVEVVAVTPLNEKTVLLMRTRDGQEIFASEAGVENEARRPGPAFAHFDPARALVFDEASGARVEARA
ncbi:MAG: ABC transporter ATP-binding protein [Pseudomonadota bacterium]|nr:ABC transporter ATP-binding protein [Pseudomonadota bacterium]